MSINDTFHEFKKYGIPTSNYSLSQENKHFNKKFNLDLLKLKCIKLIHSLRLGNHISSRNILILKELKQHEIFLEKLQLISKLTQLLDKAKAKKVHAFHYLNKEKLVGLKVSALKTLVLTIQRAITNPGLAYASAIAKSPTIPQPKLVRSTKPRVSSKNKTKTKRKWRPPYFRLIYTPMRG